MKLYVHDTGRTHRDHGRFEIRDREEPGTVFSTWPDRASAKDAIAAEVEYRRQPIAHVEAAAAYRFLHPREA